jgi:hypothetical protein
MRRQLLLVIAVAVLSSCSGSDDTPAIPDGEPNDTVAVATAITPDVPFVASIYSYADLDFYRIDVPATSWVRIQTFDASGTACNGIDTSLDLYEPSGAHVDLDNNSGIGGCEDYLAWRASGPYYVAVRGVSPDAFAYAIRVTITPIPGSLESEPNDTVAQATSLTPDLSFIAAIASYADLDFYRIVVPSMSMVRIQTFDASGATCNGINPAIDLYNSSGAYFGFEDNSGIGGCEDYLAYHGAGTTFYAAVRGVSPEMFAYSIRATVTPVSSGPEIESNDSIGTASGPYMAGTVATGAINPVGEVDYYAIQNIGSSSATFTLEVWIGGSGSCPTYDTTLTLYNSSGGQVAYDDDSSLNLCPVITATIPAYSTYYAAVRDYGNNGTVPGYLLEIAY